MLPGFRPPGVRLFHMSSLRDFGVFVDRCARNIPSLRDSRGAGKGGLSSLFILHSSLVWNTWTLIFIRLFPWRRSGALHRSTFSGSFGAGGGVAGHPVSRNDAPQKLHRPLPANNSPPAVPRFPVNRDLTTYKRGGRGTPTVPATTGPTNPAGMAPFE